MRSTSVLVSDEAVGSSRRGGAGDGELRRSMTRPAWGDRWDGLDLLAYAGFVPSIVMTAFGSEKVHNKAHRLGATYVFDKPFPLERFREAVRSLVEDRV